MRDNFNLDAIRRFDEWCINVGLQDDDTQQLKTLIRELGGKIL